MLSISYTPPRELEISAAPAEWNAIYRQISTWLAEGAPGELRFAAGADCDPTPYERYLAGWIIRGAGWPAKLEVLEDMLMLSGTRETLDAFTSFIQMDGDTGEGIHTHYEYYEGNEYISADSIPLVIAGRYPRDDQPL
jgi:hypothetical protein